MLVAVHDCAATLGMRGLQEVCVGLARSSAGHTALALYEAAGPALRLAAVHAMARQASTLLGSAGLLRLMVRHGLGRLLHPHSQQVDFVAWGLLLLQDQEENQA